MKLPVTHPNISAPNRGTTIDFGLCSQMIFDNIQYASSVPYDLDVLGDHRGVIIDINMKRLLGIDKLDEEIRLRKLVLSDRQAVEKYLKFVTDKFEKQKIASEDQK